MGTLYLVATPIGNLDDMTLRAVHVLESVPLIAAEDTRHTLKLLTHFGLRRPLVSLHARPTVALRSCTVTKPTIRRRGSTVTVLHLRAW